MLGSQDYAKLLTITYKIPQIWTPVNSCFLPIAQHSGLHAILKYFLFPFVGLSVVFCLLFFFFVCLSLGVFLWGGIISLAFIHTGVLYNFTS